MTDGYTLQKQGLREPHIVPRPFELGRRNETLRFTNSPQRWHL